MDPIFVRTARIIGEKGVDFLSTKTVAVFGIGGVGSYAAEALVRAGVGHLIFIDKDAVEDSNLNRQLVADRTTLGRNKADIMVERAHRVNPACDARALAVYYRPEMRISSKISMPISLSMPLMMCRLKCPLQKSATS